MNASSPPSGHQSSVGPVVLLVVGSSLRAEEEDRPIAYNLRERVRQRLDERLEGPDESPDGGPDEGLDQVPGAHTTHATGGATPDKASTKPQPPVHEPAARAPARAPARALVCSDIWYLNDDSLRDTPVISIGGPGDNALTAYLGDKIPPAIAIDGALLVQADLTFERLQACCWGVSAKGTEAAADAFARKYLDPFLTAALRAWA